MKVIRRTTEFTRRCPYCKDEFEQGFIKGKKCLIENGKAHKCKYKPKN